MVLILTSGDIILQQITEPVQLFSSGYQLAFDIQIQRTLTSDHPLIVNHVNENTLNTKRQIYFLLCLITNVTEGISSTPLY